jgi:hypothetical protein
MIAIAVTPENYVEAEVDITFTSIVNEIGSNKFRHDRTLIPLDKQPAVTMNRDTIYSFGIFSTPGGTTIALPKSKDDRYQAAMMLQMHTHRLRGFETKARLVLTSFVCASWRAERRAIRRVSCFAPDSRL